MQPTVFQIINYILILLVLILFIRYMWGVFFDGNYQPVDWRYALSKGKVSDKVKKIEKKYPDKVRFFTWWFLVDRLRLEEIPGDFAELGVYKGESAKILHHLDPDRTLHLFDTFSGFSGHDLGNETGKAATYTPDNFSDTEVNKVLNFIGGNVNIRIYPGYFPETAGAVGERKFALVNLDADLYNPTMAGLNFFYPRLSPGGVLLIHDYNHQWPGVLKAVDSFVSSIPESLIRVPDMDGTVIIVRNK